MAAACSDTSVGAANALITARSMLGNAAFCKSTSCDSANRSCSRAVQPAIVALPRPFRVPFASAPLRATAQLQSSVIVEKSRRGSAWDHKV